jgi:hypothetical protein
MRPGGHRRPAEPPVAGLVGLDAGAGRGGDHRRGHQPRASAAGISLGLLLSGGTPAETYALALHSETGLSASASEVMRQADSGWSVQLTAVHLPEPGSGNEQR